MKNSFKAKVVLLSTSVATFTVLIFASLYYRTIYLQIEEEHGRSLEHIAATAALQINGISHGRIRKKADAKASSFKEIRSYLIDVMYANQLTHETLYTFNLDKTHKLRFAVMLHRKPFTGDQYRVPAELKHVYRQVLLGASAHTKIYENQNGTWVSGIAPIKDRNGRVTGIIQADKSLNSILSEFFQTFTWVLISGLILVLAAFFISYSLAARLVKPVQGLVSSIKHAEEGDFSKFVETSSEDEIGLLAQKFNSLIGRFSELNNHVKKRVMTNAGEVSNSAASVLQISEHLKSSAHGQENGIKEATLALNTIHEILLNIENNSVDQRRRASEANELLDSLNLEFDQLHLNVNEAVSIARGTGEQVRTGNKIISKTITDINSIQKKSENLTELIELLNSISEKLQMLSLNASIEAARSGGADSGFQVVANEITELSDKTTRSTSQAVDQLREVTKSIARGAESLKESVKLFDEIFGAVSQLSTTLKSVQGKSSQYIESTRHIDEHLNYLESLSAQISRKISEATSSEQEVLKTIEQLSEAASQVARQSEEVNESSHRLSEYSEQLRSVVG